MGLVRTIGKDCCWNGGAIWQSNKYKHTQWPAWILMVSTGPMVTWTFTTTTIVVVGSDLHDENIPIMEYTKGFRNRLEHKWYAPDIIFG